MPAALQRTQGGNEVRRLDTGVKLLLVVCMLAAVTVGLMGCPKTKPVTQGPPEEPPASTLTPQGEPYKIGGVFALSGPPSSLGQPEADTAKMIVEQVNAEGGINGRPLEIIIRDTKGQETECLAAVKELVEKEKVLAIVGPSTSGETLGVIEYIESAQVPLVSCAAAAKITTPVRKWVFKTPQTDAHAVENIYKYLKGKGITKIATMTVSNAYGDAGLEQLKAQAEGAGIKIVASEQFNESDTDMTAQITRIKGTDAQAIVCWSVGPAPALITKQIRQLGLKIPIIQSHGVANKRFIEGAGDAAEGVVLPAGKLLVADQLPDSDRQKSVLIAYRDAFQAKYNSDVNTFGGHAWDAMQIVIKAIRQAGEDRAAIRDAIEATKDFVGIGGIFNYSPEDHYGLTADAFVMVTIKNGQWTLAE